MNHRMLSVSSSQMLVKVDRHDLWDLMCKVPVMRTTALCLMLFTAASITAQNNDNTQRTTRSMTLSGGLFIGEPLGQFDAAFGREIIGLGANFATPILKLPIEWGAQFNWGTLGGEDAIVAVDEEFLGTTEGTMKVKSNMYAVHGLARFKPLQGQVRPYFDLMAGWRTFSTRTKLRVEDIDGTLTNEKNETDWTTSLGWAVGLMYGFNHRIYAEGRFEKLNGGRVTYVDDTSIAITPEGLVTYETKTSQTDMFNIVLAVGFNF